MAPAKREGSAVEMNKDWILLSAENGARQIHMLAQNRPAMCGDQKPNRADDEAGAE
jgi:hypothetical protein